jgi:molybdopterin molybdotransferase
MISFEEACKTIQDSTMPLGIQRRTLDNMLGMVLAEAIKAPFSLPRFNNSAVDGYGVKIADVKNASPQSPVELQLIGTIQAGDVGKIQIEAGETVRIFTGASVPKTVEAVIMQEYTELRGERVAIAATADPGENIRLQGEEFRRGQPVIAKDTIITPPVIGLLASMAYASAAVYKKPKVGLISTGNELAKPGKPLSSGQIYDSNTYALSAALRAVGIEKIKVYTARDEHRATRRAFETAIKENDIIISLGGISVGAFDFVKDVAEQIGIETVFWRIAIKPGKPVYFGKKGKKRIFGLPGNPVSALVTYHQLVQPALRKMMGYPDKPAIQLKARLGARLRKKPGRQEFVRGILNYDGIFRVTPAIGQDSHMLGGLMAANCLIDFPTAAETLSEHDSVSVDLLDWSFHGL